MRGLRSRSRLSRTYVGSTDRLTFSQDVRIAGEFHAANSALVDWSAHNEIYGAVFAGNFKWSQQTLIHYDRGVFRAGDLAPGEAGAPGPRPHRARGTACLALFGSKPPDR